jgi:1-acyl-sn-glycerol-3-phosphate acyltransferase
MADDPSRTRRVKPADGKRTNRGAAEPTSSATGAKPATSAPRARRVKPVDGTKAKPVKRAATTPRIKPAAGEKSVKPAAASRRRVTSADGAKHVSPKVTRTPSTDLDLAPAPGAASTRDANKPVDELLRLVGELAKHVIGADGDQKAAQAIEFVRRRLTGDYEVDAFGFDQQLTDTVLLPALRPLYRRWFRVDVHGIENVPAEGAALIVANHSGTIPLDSLMTEVAVHDEHPAHRHLRMLGADLLFQLPFLSDVARKNGTTLACTEDTERLLAAGELVGVWPEGFKGIGKPFTERYKLQRFGRGGFVSAAIRAQAPIVPCAIVGAEETYPMIANLGTLARMIGVPYVPITPTFPWLGPLGLVPLPSKWIIEFGEPIPTDAYGDGAVEDPMLVFELTDRVRETIQQTLYALLVRRRSTFF